MYGSYENIPPSLQAELTPLWGFTWLCPNFTPDEYFLLQNDPLNYNFGTNFNLVINYCYVMPIGIDPALCETDHPTMWAYLANVKVSHKFVRQYFNS